MAETRWAELAAAFLYPAEADESLQAEYVRLFVNAVPTVPCPPYASYYLGGTLMGRANVEVEALCRAWGLALASEAEPALACDHIAVELELLSMLEELSADDAEARGDRDRMLDHLRRWSPSFLERVERHDRSGVFAAAARSTRGALFGERSARPEGPGMRPTDEGPAPR
jgi:TorA maturation chaperone TorD